MAGPRGSGNPTGLDGTKKAGQNAGDAFSRTGNALANLNAAASEQIPTGGSGFNGAGGGGAGQNDKGPGGNGAGGSKSVGESLAFLAAKARQEKALELEFEKQKLNDPGLLWGQIRNDALKSIATEGFAKPMGKWVGGMFESLTASKDSPAIIRCTGLPDVPKSSAKICPDPAKDFACFRESGGVYSWIATPGASGTPCQVIGSKDAGATSTTDANGAGSAAGVGSAKSISDVCKLKGIGTPLDAGAVANDGDTYVKDNLKPAVGGIDVGKKLLEGGALDPNCGGTMPTLPTGATADDSAMSLLNKAKATLSKAAVTPAAGSTDAADPGGVLQQMSAMSATETDIAKVKTAAGSFKTADDQLQLADKLADAAADQVKKVITLPPEKDSKGQIIDPVLKTSAAKTQQGQQGVATQATTIKGQIKQLRDEITKAKNEIADDTAVGTLYDVVKANKVSPDIKADATAQVTEAAMPKVSAKAPADTLGKITQAYTDLGEANKLLPLPKEGEEDPNGKRTQFTSKRATADGSLKAAQAEEKKLIDGHAAAVDAVSYTPMLR